MLEVKNLSRLAAYQALADMGMRYLHELAVEAGFESRLLECAADDSAAPFVS